MTLDAISHSIPRIPAAGGEPHHLQRDSGQEPKGICSQGWRESAAGGREGTKGWCTERVQGAGHWLGTVRTQMAQREGLLALLSPAQMLK